MAKSVLEWTLVAFDRASPIFNGTARSADQMGRAIKGAAFAVGAALATAAIAAARFASDSKIGRASCRERVYVLV